MTHPRQLATPLALAVAFTALLAASPAFCQGPPGGEMPPTAVEVAKPTVEMVAETIAAIGTLRADEVVTVRPEVAGLVEAVLFAEGEKVEKGAPLFRLDSALVKADVAEMQASASNSERELKRAQELVSRKLIAQADVDNKRAAAAVNAAKLASSRTRLSKTQIRAPFAGTVGLRKVSPGEFVNAGDALVDLVALDPLKVDFSVPEAIAGRVQPKQKVIVRIDAFGAREFIGEVYAVAPQIDLATRSIALRAVLPNADGALRPGQFGHVALEIGAPGEALMIPEQALWPQGDKQFVYVVRDGKAELAEVKTGMRKPGTVQIVTGIGANDSVIVAGQMKIGPGAKVSPVPHGGAPAKQPAGAPAADAAAH